MNGRFSKAWVALGTALALTACGGGGGYAGSAPAPSPGPTPSAAPPVSGTPTATLSRDQTTANSLVTAAKSAAASLVTAGSLSGVPLGVIVSPPSGVTSSGSANCTNSGSYSYSFNFAGSGQVVAGDTWTATYTNCSFTSGSSINGTVTATYTRYTAANSLAFNITATGFTESSGGITYGPNSYTAHYDLSAGAATYSYTVNGITVVNQPVVTVSGYNVTIASGTVHTNCGDGWAQIAYSNWAYNSATGIPTSGTITVTASSGDTATVTITGNGYAVALTVSGITTNYTVPFS